MLEPVYRLAPDLLRSGRVNLPAGENAAARDARMTDFRLLRHGGFYHAVARYGDDLWTPFTYAGHPRHREGACGARSSTGSGAWTATLSDEDRYLRIGNRTFYEDPDQEVEPSAQVVVAVDAWARELARNTLSGNTPTIFCTPDGHLHSGGGTSRPSLRPGVRPVRAIRCVGRPETAGLWLSA